jgi:hypothetical protein
MLKYSKAIAALVSAIVGALVAFGVVSPSLADTLAPGTVEMIVGTIMAIAVSAGVWVAPANDA